MLACRFPLVAAALPLVLLGASSVPPENLALRRLIEKGRHPAIRWGRFSDVQSGAKQLYGRNGWAPLWLADNHPTQPARALLDVFALAADRGLDPQDYDAAQLAALAANLDRGGADIEQAIRFDAALTIGALRFSRALARGRISVREAGIRPGAAAVFDPVAVVESLRHAERPEPVLGALEPSWSPYRDLKQVLARYRQLSRDTVAPRSARSQLAYQSRIRQLELALERWRWLPRTLGDRSLFVSVPAFRLEVPPWNDQPGPVRMNVRIGDGPCRQLQVVGEELRMLVFRPAAHSSMLVKFPLAGDIYFYGNSPEAIADPMEKGCVRVADPELLAELLLRDRPDWTRERIRQAMAGNRQIFVRLKHAVPVLLVYGTAVAGGNGQVSFVSDAYGHDRRLDQLLRRGYPYPE